MGNCRYGLGCQRGELSHRTRAWITEHVPSAWRAAAERGGAAAIREVRTRAEYEAWYPVFAHAGFVAPTWPIEYGGAGLSPDEARIVEAELSPYNLGRLNPLGLSLAAPALLAHGTEGQRLRYLPPIVHNEEVWCQLFSEPGAGSDLASLSTRAERDGDGWVISGQKVWNTWAHLADYGVLLARTDPDVPKRQGITYFLIDLHEKGVDVRPLRHITGEVDFNEVFLDAVRVPDSRSVSETSTRAGRWPTPRSLVSARWWPARARAALTESVEAGPLGSFDWPGRSVPMDVPVGGMIQWSGKNSCGWPEKNGSVAGRTNAYGREQRQVVAPAPESSVGKVHQGDLNQRVQRMATDLLGAASTAWLPTGSDGFTEHTSKAYASSLPYEVRGMLRSRANTIEGGTTEVNKNIIAERVLGLPREPDPWNRAPWRDVPRS